MKGEFGELESVLEYLPDTPGFYLDLGCAYPDQNSNTQLLREMGWWGLAIDANPVYADAWEGVDHFVAAILGDGNPMGFEMNPVPVLSRAGGSEIRGTVRLNDLLVSVDKIDFVSCDLEGMEYDVLKDFDWERYFPRVVIAEYNTAGIGKDFRLMELLVDKGYWVVGHTKANLIYISSK